MIDSATDPTASGRLSFLSGRRLSQILLLLLIVSLCIVSGLLIKQNRDLKAAITNMGKPPELLKPGQQVPPLAANTVSGQRQAINYADRAKTVLMVFSPQCSACERALPYWKEIKEVCARNQYQVFGISLDNAAKTNAFLASNGLSLQSFIEIDAETTKAFKLTITPQTIVVGSDGKVEKVWPGAFNSETKAEVEKYFGISVMDDAK